MAARLGNAGGVAIGFGDGEMFIASDMPAILEHTRRMVFLENRPDGRRRPATAPTFSTPGRRSRSSPQVHTIPWDPVSAAKGEYKHFMQKEIYEQANSLTDTIRGRVDLGSGEVYLEEVHADRRAGPRAARRWSASPAAPPTTPGWSAQFMFEQLARLPVRGRVRLRVPLPRPGDRRAHAAAGHHPVGRDGRHAGGDGRGPRARARTCCPSSTSSAARPRASADSVIYMHTGPEIGVASTKAFTASLVDQYLLALHLGTLRGTLSAEQRRGAARRPGRAARRWSGSCSTRRRTSSTRSWRRPSSSTPTSSTWAAASTIPIALEGALKLKEISYIHAEGYPAGEMKHGPIALIDEHMPVVAIAPQDRVYDKMISQIEQVKARGGIVIAVATEGDDFIAHQGRPRALRSRTPPSC